MLNFSGKTAFLTGGSGGIGLVTAQMFLRQGARVVLFDIDADGLEQARQTLDGSVETVQGDVTNMDDLLRAVQVAGQIDVLVCLNGLFALAEIGQMDGKVIDKVFAVNVKGTIFAVDAALTAMTNGGAIVLVSSSAHRKAIPQGTLYAASKAAVRGYARNAALELLPRGIRVNTVCPGPVDTERMAAPVPVPQEIRDQAAGFIPMQRLGDPKEIASSILFLSSDEASFITGAELTVDGGLCNL